MCIRDRVYLATDPDREGEAISWHLAQALKIDDKDINRISFNEITKNAVKAVSYTHLCEVSTGRADGSVCKTVGGESNKLFGSCGHGRYDGRGF